MGWRLEMIGEAKGNLSIEEKDYTGEGRKNVRLAAGEAYGDSKDMAVPAGNAYLER